MKKGILTLMCLLAMMATSLSVKAQEVTITLMPGWNWISVPLMDTLNFQTAMGTITSVDGDIIKSHWGSAFYSNGQWRGTISQFYPGYGYHYKSNRTEPIMVTFNAQQPAPQVVVTTSEPTDITSASAIVGGTVTLDEGNHVYACGVCWNTVQMPTVDGNHTSNDANAGAFTDTLTELSPNTTYYVRAYVVTDYGLAYGDEQNLTTLDNSSNVPEGAINGLFTINENGDQVYFSHGNLQYIGSAATPYWKFADTQWDYFGDNGQGSEDQNVDRDLFGWGTSGYNHNNKNFQPWCISTNSWDYYAYGVYNNNLYDQTGQADWGYNPISNGGNQECFGWRTLTHEEWTYLFETRTTNSGILYVMGKVNGINGVILLPDTWIPSIYPLNSSNVSDFDENTISEEDWVNIFEVNGAVFLPAAGSRYGNAFSFLGSNGYYWSSSYCSYYNGLYSYRMCFGSNGIYQNYYECCYGYSVRLVKDCNP